MATYTYTLLAEDWGDHEVTCDEVDIEKYLQEYARAGLNWTRDWPWEETIYQRVSLRRSGPLGDENAETAIVAVDPPVPPCRGDAEHDWSGPDAELREECRHCLMSRWMERPTQIALLSGEKVDNRSTRLQCVTYVTHDDERSPEAYSAWVDQTEGIDHERNLRWTKRVDVCTDGSDYLPGDWNEMTEDERDEHDEWVARLHDARVELAELDPDDREWVTEHAGDTGDPDSLEAALDLYRLREQCRSAYSGMTEAQQRDVDALITDDDAWDDPQRFQEVIDEVYARWSEPVAAN